jgi:hypothetical protein
VGGLTMYPSRLNLVDFLTPLMIDKCVWMCTTYALCSS